VVVNQEMVEELVALSAEEVLGTMFFTPVLGRLQTEQESPHRGVRLCFLSGTSDPEHPDTAAPGGHLDIEVSNDAAQAIAANFLAVDEGSAPDHKVDDVLCELGNIICGKIMSDLASGTGFSMLSPEIIRGAGAEWPNVQRFEESFELERGWLRVRLALIQPEHSIS
jgi:Chemotaxis phosphatase CheX